MTERAETARATAWLSHDLAVLARDLDLDQPTEGCAETPPKRDERNQRRPDFDVVIVGSGYGGSMALHELAGYGLAGKPLRIALLERGKEYLPGAFPSRASDLAGAVRFSTRDDAKVRGRPEGLFDIRVGPDVGVLLANGLGGGSLINAGVMARPLGAVLQDAKWPAPLRNDLPACYDTVERLLRAVPAPNVRERVEAMSALGKTKAPAVTVADAANPAEGIAACSRCGDCMTGCNFRAKLSVDVTLVAPAIRKHPGGCIRVVTGATVVDFEADPSGWALKIVHTEQDLRRKQQSPYALTTRFLILAAGTLGSTELLMRGKDRGVSVSPRLGARFSANGDNLAAIYGTAAKTQCIGDENAAFDQRTMGPTITQMVDLRLDGGPAIQDLGVPGPLRRLFEEATAASLAVRQLAETDCSRYLAADSRDAATIDARAVDGSLLVAVIGRDSASGCLSRPPAAASPDVGTLGVVWPGVHSDASFDAAQEVLTGLAQAGHPGAQVLPNPLWRPLPLDLEGMFGKVAGPVLSVHPLGGCVMADSGASGVVDHLGRVFKGSGADVHEGLVVLDGSIVPMSLGINPSLTIATLAYRALARLRMCWDCTQLPAMQSPLIARPSFGDPPPRGTRDSTWIQMTEQMIGNDMLSHRVMRRRCKVELELWFRPLPIGRLVYRDGSRTLCVDESKSRIRLRAVACDMPDVMSLGRRAGSSRVGVADEDAMTAVVQPVLFEARLHGTLSLLRHGSSRRWPRTLRALWAWFRNRGLRDAYQYIRDWVQQRDGRPTATFCQFIRGAFRLASRAGDVRTLEYALSIGAPDPSTVPLDAALSWVGRPLRIVKSLTYERAGNPLNQLMSGRLVESPDAAAWPVGSALGVDLPYFGHSGIPLVRIVQQADQPAALVDLGSLLAYLGRVLLPLHAWTLRLPDRPKPAVAQAASKAESRLPGAVPGLPPPAKACLQVDPQCPGTLRLTRYRADSEDRRPPVLLIHGYSASGTTFVHECLPSGGLVGALCRDGRDVWVLDMRSSAGQDTAQVPWSFEQMGYQDIPLAVEHIVNTTGQEAVDVVAHCMGAAMLALGLFGKNRADIDIHRKQRKALPACINRLVLSQVGPALVVSPSNMARAYAFSWIQHMVQLGKFEFTPKKPTTGDDMLDRLLSVVPYPREDFFRENPFWQFWKTTPWTGTRHRMDSLYGITFRLDAVSDNVLDAIDDLFGPLNLLTVAQVIAFARYSVVTDRQGDGAMMTPERIGARLSCKVLCLHGTANGLIDFRTRDRMFRMFRAAHVQGDSVRLENMGHQDSLIGRRAPEVYERIKNFLNEERR